MNVFDIQTNETTYKPGSQVSGTIKILRGGGLSLRDISIKVEGKESTIIIKNEQFTTPDSHTNQTRPVTYTEENAFYHLDLSQFVFNAHDTNEQFYEIPFNFILPELSLPTFHSNNVDISYEITAIWERKWSGDEKQTASFLVVPSMNVSNYQQIKVSGSNNKGIQIGLDLERQAYSRRESIKGIAKILDPNKKIRSLSFILIGTEKALAKGQSESISKVQEQKLRLDLEKDIDINFVIPQDIPFSFTGKLSAYSYEVDLKGDIALSSDIHAKAGITIT